MTLHSMNADVAKAVHNRLSTHLAVQQKLGDPARAYDAAPEDPVFPYLTYGDMRSEDQSGDGVFRFRHIMTLHLWSRYAGRAEVMDIISAVSGALHETPLSLAGGSEASAVIPYTDILRAADGRTLHGLIRLHLYSQNLGAVT